MSKTKKRAWSKEAREAASIRAKAKWGKNDPDPPPLPRELPSWAEGIVLEDKEIKEESVTPSLQTRYLAKRGFDYMPDVMFELGEIVQLRGAPNDQKLIGLNYVMEWSGNADWEHECIKCGKVFGHSAGYAKHCASHYDKCSICGKEIPPERMNDHFNAHQELGVS